MVSLSLLCKALPVLDTQTEAVVIEGHTRLPSARYSSKLLSDF